VSISRFVTGTYSNCFQLHDAITKTTLTVEAADDVREPRLVAVQAHQPHADYKTAPLFPASSGPGPASGSLHDVRLMKRPPPPQVNRRIEVRSFRNKIIRCAWHPRLNAVAVAGLYKLYLYQAKAFGGAQNTAQQQQAQQQHQQQHAPLSQPHSNGHANAHANGTGGGH
jgi:hypothetical protein